MRVSDRPAEVGEPLPKLDREEQGIVQGPCDIVGGDVFDSKFFQKARRTRIRRQ